MPAIHVYEPALCCNTGVCGPDLDQRLVTFTADLDHVVDAGGELQRHNLANDPQAFAEDETVRSFLQVAGSAGLPLTLVDGVTVLTGRYPDRGELLRWAGLSADAADTSNGQDSTHRDLGLTAAGADDGCCSSTDEDSACCSPSPAASAPGTSTSG